MPALATFQSLAVTTAAPDTDGPLTATTTSEDLLRLLIDWNNDGDWGDTGENVSARLIATERTTAVRGRDQIRQLAPPMAGSFSGTLSNLSRDYSPGNFASPLAGLLEPGPLVRMQYVRADTPYTLATTILDDLPQHPERSRQTVEIQALGTLSRLRGKKISTTLYTDITTDVALGHLLDAAGWPSGAGARTLNSGATTLLYWWLDDEDAFTAALALVATEGPGAVLYEDADGRAVFEGRQYRIVTSRCTTIQASFADTGVEPYRLEDLSYSPGRRDVVNRCTVEVRRRAAQSLAAIWTIGETVTLAAGETRTYTIRTAGGDPFTAAVTPASGTDYTLTAGSLSTVSLSRTSGASTVLTLTAGGSGATLTGLQLRAQAVTITNTTTIEDTLSAETTASRTRYGTVTFPLTVRHEIGLEVARDFCNAIVQRYRLPRPSVRIVVPGITTITVDQILTRQISDRIGLTDAQTGLSIGVHIEQIEYTYLDYVLTAVFGGEEAQDTSEYAIWGTGEFDTAKWAF